MSRFEIKMKLSGLELDIKGSREDIPLIAQNLAQQITGLIAPAAAIAGGEVIENAQVPAKPTPLITEVTPRKRRRTGSSTRPASTEEGIATAVDFRHDSTKYGSAKQSWSTPEKAFWLLYVVGEQTQHKELSGAVIAATFNKHFKQAKMITVGHVNRDLGRAKVRKGGSFIGEDTTKTPSLWYLTEEGRKQAQKLVNDALGRSE